MSEIDLDKYRRHLDRYDISEAKKTELIKAVCLIMQSFVDRAFGDDPVQQIGNGVAERRGDRGIAAPEDKSATKRAPDSDDVLGSKVTPKNRTDASGMPPRPRPR